MDLAHISELVIIINDIFGWHKSRSTCFAYFIFGVLSICTVTLSKVSTTFSGMTQISSRQKRLKRFLVWISSSKSDYKLQFAKFVLKNLQKVPLILSMDRTNWKFGSYHINFLVIGVWYQGISIPIYWINLAAAGNSDSLIRRELLKKILAETPVKRIEYLLADREFVGNEWFQYLQKEKIPFAIRIKDNVWSEVTRSGYTRKRKVAELFKNMKRGKIWVIKNCIVYGHRLNLASCLSTEGDLVVIATTGAPKKALKAYRKRWSIESLFACLKGRGFNFEDTRVVDAQRVEGLLLVLSFALFWSMQVGVASVQEKPLEIAKHGRPRTSIFRRGLDILRESIIQLHLLLRKLISCIGLLKGKFCCMVGRN